MASIVSNGIVPAELNSPEKVKQEQEFTMSIDNPGNDGDGMGVDKTLVMTETSGREDGDQMR